MIEGTPERAALRQGLLRAARRARKRNRTTFDVWAARVRKAAAEAQDPVSLPERELAAIWALGRW